MSNEEAYFVIPDRTVIRITIALHCIALHCVLVRNDVELDSHGLQTRQLINQQISNISSLPFSNFVNV